MAGKRFDNLEAQKLERQEVLDGAPLHWSMLCLLAISSSWHCSRLRVSMSIYAHYYSAAAY